MRYAGRCSRNPEYTGAYGGHSDIEGFSYDHRNHASENAFRSAFWRCATTGAASSGCGFVCPPEGYRHIAAEARQCVQALNQTLSRPGTTPNMEAFHKGKEAEKKIAEQINEALVMTFVSQLER